MSEIEKFKAEVVVNIESQAKSAAVRDASMGWLNQIVNHKYTHNFRWMGRPIIQFPQDVVAMQEIIWDVQPDLIIETGIAHGGSLIFYAAMLELNAICGGPGEAQVLGIDIDIREHNRAAIESHPMAKRIKMIQGSSIAPEMIAQVRSEASFRQRVLVVLDSNHTHEHVLAELEGYAPLTSVGSYCVVFDTLVEDMPAAAFSDRPWGPGDNPKTAVWEYLKAHDEFQIDKNIENKLLITVAPDGYLKRLR